MGVIFQHEVWHDKFTQHVCSSNIRASSLISVPTRMKASGENCSTVSHSYFTRPKKSSNTPMSQTRQRYALKNFKRWNGTYVKITSLPLLNLQSFPHNNKTIWLFCCRILWEMYSDTICHAYQQIKRIWNHTCCSIIHTHLSDGTFNKPHITFHLPYFNLSYNKNPTIIYIVSLNTRIYYIFHCKNVLSLKFNNNILFIYL
jgi:hypothetical protein